MAATSAKSQQKSASKIEFDAANWKVIGYFTKYATFEDEPGRYSIYMASSTFSFTIPRDERQGSIQDVYLPYFDGGRISGSYMKKIELLLQARAMDRFRVIVPVPKLLERKRDL